jgi:hypothetical protein
MIRFGLIGATAVALTLAAPAMARGMHHVKGATAGEAVHPHVFNYDRDLPVEDALRLGYSQGYSEYPSGFGGLYGDGLYPGNVISHHNP